MEYQNFKLEIDEQGIAVFTANRPEKMNALNDLSWAEIPSLGFSTLFFES